MFDSLPAEVVERNIRSVGCVQTGQQLLEFESSFCPFWREGPE